MYTHFIGIDNGTTGSIGVVNTDGSYSSYVCTPTKKAQNYTKEKKEVTRIDTDSLEQVLKPYSSGFAFLERPMVNPMRFVATVSAVRALEATLIVLEKLKIPFEYLDSKKWQHLLLPSGIWKVSTTTNGRTVQKADSKTLKKASKDVVTRMFANAMIDGDGEGLLIAEYGRRQKLGIK
jgi:hypothetical protein